MIGSQADRDRDWWADGQPRRGVGREPVSRARAAVMVSPAVRGVGLKLRGEGARVGGGSALQYRKVL